MSTSAEKVLQLARVSNELLTRFQEREERAATEKQAALAMVSAAVQSLVDNERIFPDQRNDVAEKIASSHLACIELIRDLAKHRNASEIEQIGTHVKTAGDQPGRATGAPISDYDERPSGQRYRTILMQGQ